MTPRSPSLRLLPWVAAVLLSIAAAFGAIETARMLLERNLKQGLSTEVTRRAMEIMAVTMNGNVMGSVATMGLVNHPMKKIARGEIPLEDRQAMEVLRSVGEAYRATGVYVVNRDGIIQSNWYTTGRSLSGVDVKFRPYFQIAMQGKQNVYAAIGTTTGQRALYFAAPLYDAVSASSPIIGAMVIRLDVDRVDSALNAWPGPALLLSPQQITFASNRGDWVEQIAQEPTPEQLKSIRALKQFGSTFETGTPKTLPFDSKRETVNFENQRYAVERAPVQWNDPLGEWTLVLLGDLDALMPVSRRAAIGATTGALVLVLCALFLVWRRRLQHARAERWRAVEELKAYAGKLELDSETKSFLAEMSADLHQASSLADFAGRFMRHAAPRADADYGAFYVLDEGSGLLTPAGGYGALAQHLQAVAIGQGLVGQCAKDMTPIAISGAAATDIRVVWGEGNVAPRSIIFLPVAQADRLLGVIVLAALRPIDAEKRALLDAIVPLVAANLEILERNLGTQRQAELLQQQQTHLQETEAWYRGIVESAPDGMLVVDEQGVIILTNPQIDATFGYSAGALVGAKIEVLVPSAVRSRHPGLRERFVQSGSMRVIRELRGVRQDGSEFPVEVGLSRLPALGGRGVCVCASVRDITERMRAEEAIRLANEEQTAIFESATLGIAFIKDRVIVRGNGKLNELFGLSSEEQIGQSTRIWYPDDDAYAAGGGSVYEDLKCGHTHQRDQLLQRKDGIRFWCRLSGRAVDSSDLSRGTVWMLEDITERKQAEDELKERMEELERFGRLTIDREEKMIQLKEEINGLLAQTGKEQKYKIVV